VKCTSRECDVPCVKHASVRAEMHHLHAQLEALRAQTGRDKVSATATEPLYDHSGYLHADGEKGLLRSQLKLAQVRDQIH
jgi:hypothetical protein